MYTLNNATGKVTRDSDGVVVAPTSNMESQDYLDFVAWGKIKNNKVKEVYIEPFDEQAYAKQVTDIIQQVLDKTAQQYGYDGILSAVSYQSSSHPKFGTEGRAFLAWRDAVWDHCYAVLYAVNAGQRSIPTVAELLDELPKLTM